MCLLKIKFMFFLFNLDIVKYFQQMYNLKQISSAHGIFPLFHAEWLGFVSLIAISVAMVVYYHGLNNTILNSSRLSVIESFHFHRWYFQSYFRCKIKWWKIPTDIHIFCFSYSWLYMCKSWNFYCAWHMLLLIPFSAVIFYLLRLEHSRESSSVQKRDGLTKLCLYLLWLRWCFLWGVSNCHWILWSFRQTEHLMLWLQGTRPPSCITSNRWGGKKWCCKAPSAALHSLLDELACDANVSGTVEWTCRQHYPGCLPSPILPT